MRVFEDSLDERVVPDGWIVLRLDGRDFTKLTKEVLDFTRPFDERLHLAMRNTCAHLMEAGAKFVLCYTQSDEISMLLNTEDMPFSGKTRKLNSVFAGEASARFSLEIARTAAFDCRVIPLGPIENVIDYFRWRGEDARRNGLTAYCYWGLRATGLSPRDADRRMNGLSKDEKYALLAELNIDFDRQEDWKRLGAFLTWTDVEHEGVDPRVGSAVMALRQRLQWLDRTPEGVEIAKLIKSIV